MREVDAPSEEALCIAAWPHRAVSFQETLSMNAIRQKPVCNRGGPGNASPLQVDAAPLGISTETTPAPSTQEPLVKGHASRSQPGSARPGHHVLRRLD